MGTKDEMQNADFKSLHLKALDILTSVKKQNFLSA